MIKNFIQKVFIAALMAASFCSFAYTANEFHVEDQPAAIEQVVQIEQKGILKQKPNGYLYIDVSNDYISKVLPMIDVPGKIVPLRCYENQKGIGAHISVMYEKEQIENEIWEIAELGQEYTFSIIELRTVKVNWHHKAKKLWIIAVAAPELENLRQKYGLKPFIKGHDFHITIGTQIPGKAEQSPAADPLDMEEAELEEAAV